MGLIITDNKRVDEYFSNKDHVSQSDLKPLLNSLESYLEYHKDKRDSTSAMIIGSIVDTILTGDEKDFENNYYVLPEDFNFPSEAERNIIEETFLLATEDGDIKDLELENLPNHILAACKTVGWGQSWKDTTKIRKILEVGNNYFEILKTSSGKTVIDYETSQICKDIVQSLVSSYNTKFYYNRDVAKSASVYKQYRESSL